MQDLPDGRMREDVAAEVLDARTVGDGDTCQEDQFAGGRAEDVAAEDAVVLIHQHLAQARGLSLLYDIATSVGHGELERAVVAPLSL